MVRLRRVRPHVFEQAGAIAAAGGFAEAIVAIVGSLWRARALANNALIAEIEDERAVLPEDTCEIRPV